MKIEELKAVLEQPFLFTREQRREAAAETIKILDAIAERGDNASNPMSRDEQTDRALDAILASIGRPDDVSCCDNPDIIRRYGMKEWFCLNCNKPAAPDAAKEGINE